jgi:hypothetical protein
MSHFLFRPASLLVALSTIPLIALTGCGAANSFSNPSASTTVTGKVFGGQQPVAGSTVTVWQAGTAGYGSAATSLATTTTAEDGTFTFASGAYTCPTPTTQVYITAQGGSSVSGFTNANIALATGLGNCAAAKNDTVEINEVTTAATAFALAQFFTTTLGSTSTDSFGTNVADLPSFTLSNTSTIPTLIDIPNGLVKPNTAAITIDAAKIYSIANTLAACVNDAASFTNCTSLYGYTTPPSNGSNTPVPPTDTLQAAVQMALYPYQNVTPLYQLAPKTPPFVGGTAPNDWTIGVSYTSSNYALSINGTAASATSASIDIDATGKVWFASNLSGHTGLANFDPSTTAFNGPYLAGKFTQPQYVAIDTTGLVWTTDTASSNYGYVSTTTPTTVSSSGPVMIDGITALGPIAADGTGDVYFTYLDASGTPNLGGVFGGSTFESTGVAYTYPPTGLVTENGFTGASTSGSNTPCANELIGNYGTGTQDYVYASTSGTCTSGGVAFAAEAQDTLTATTSLDGFCSAMGGVCQTSTAVLNLPEGIATDGYGNEWVANSGNGSVFTFGSVLNSYPTTSTIPYLHNASYGNTETAPYAIAIDGSGNIWLANASCVTNSATPCTPTAFVLSEIIGAAAPTITPLSAQVVGSGFLIGNPPGTSIPTPAVSAHPLIYRH